MVKSEVCTPDSFSMTQASSIAIAPFSNAAREVTVDGASFKRQPCSLNKGCAIVSIGSMSFTCAYTQYSRSDDFKRLRDIFWSQARIRKAQDASTAALALMPMPAQQTQSIGQWTLATELGKGATGKVYSATNSSGAKVAIKVVERNRRSVASIQREIGVLEELTQEAKRDGCKNIILLVEVIATWPQMLLQSFRISL
jgi:hypothetical protein